MEENTTTEQFIIDLLYNIAANNYLSLDPQLTATLRPYKAKHYCGPNVFSFDVGRAIAHFADRDIHGGKYFLETFVRKHLSKTTDELKAKFDEELQAFGDRYLEGRRNRPENFFEYCGYIHNLFLSCCSARRFVLIPVLIEALAKAFKRLAFDIYIDRGNYQNFAETLLSSLKKDKEN